jgi:hypothetical protein
LISIDDWQISRTTRKRGSCCTFYLNSSGEERGRRAAAAFDEGETIGDRGTVRRSSFAKASEDRLSGDPTFEWMSLCS